MVNRIVKDKGGTLRYYSVESLGPSQRLTPEGFLICEGVPIARTGTQVYMAEEVDLVDAGNGEVRIIREDKEVFREETRASFEGKPVTVDHPDDFVNPGNWKELAVGVTQNVRRGTGGDTDLLVADLLITDQDAIDLVRAGLREVSCGYSASYEQDMPGMGFQRDIIGNHVALVKRGRAGPRCSIQDKETQTMKPKLSWIDKLRLLLKDAEAEEKKTDDEIEAEEEEAKKKSATKTGDALKQILDKLKSMDEDIQELKKKSEDADEDDEDDDGETADTILAAETAGKANIGSVYKGGPSMTGDALVDTKSRAEILSPGIKLPTTDSVAGDVAERLQRSALKAYFADKDHADMEKTFLAGRKLDALTSDALHTVFVGVSELAKQQNNAGGAQKSMKVSDFGKVSSISELNKRNQEFWAAKRGSK